MQKIGFKQSRISEENYFQWRKNRGKPGIRRIDKVIDLKNKIVLDVGCGNGALSSLLLDKGAIVYGTETDLNKLEVANKTVNNSNAQFLHVKDEQLPFKNNYFDLVILFDVIEHVNDPVKMMQECKRVLKPSGLLYVEFTPYYSITGHHLYDYAKWPIHILPKNVIKKIVYSKKIKSFMPPKYYWDLFKSLNKLRVTIFQKMAASEFSKLDERFIIKYPEVFEVNLKIVNRFGFFKDYFTMSYEGLFRKT